MASGDFLVGWEPTAHEPWSSSGVATLDIRGNGHPVLDFDQSLTEIAQFSAWMPEHYDGGGATVTARLAASSATTGTVVVVGMFERVAAGAETDNLDTDSFAAGITATATARATAGLPFDAVMQFTNGAGMDSVSAAALFRFRLQRSPTATGDNMSGDLELRALKIVET